MERDPRRSNATLYVVVPALIVSPFVSGALRRHHVGTPWLRALIVGVVAAALVFAIAAVARLARARPSRLSPWAPIIVAILVAIASLGSDWITAYLG